MIEREIHNQRQKKKRENESERVIGNELQRYCVYKKKLKNTKIIL